MGAAAAVAVALSLQRRVVHVRGALVRLGDALGVTEDREAIAAGVVEAAAALVGADGAAFWLDTPSGPRPRIRRGTVHERGEDLVQRAGRELVPVTGRGVAAVPVLARGRLFGVISVERRRAFRGPELDELAGVARQASSAVEATFLHEESKRLSLTDGLTGLWNRRQFELRVAQELERAARFGERFALVIIDLDNFKRVNDTYGHLVGDAVLVATAERLVEGTREVDTVARFGGEEFVLLLPQTELPGALKVAEKVREEVAGQPVETDAGPLAVSLSAGVACHPDDGTTLAQLLAAADGALYRAKAAGKNRVVHAEPTTQP